MSDTTTSPSTPDAGGSGTHTRTILEIVGAAVAVVLIVLAAGAGFVAGVIVGDDDGVRGPRPAHADGRGHERGDHGSPGMGDMPMDDMPRDDMPMDDMPMDDLPGDPGTPEGMAQ